jgi:adenosylcobalamin-dependent ribonucleoside-triphosphate reductase
MMGTDFLKFHGGAALNNCGFASTENIDENFAEPFCWLMDMSMLGVGVGGDTDGAGKVVIAKPERIDRDEFIPDSREGWIEAVRLTLMAYVGIGAIPRWRYDLIREYGTPIKGFGGVAAGPGPLKQLLEIDIPAVLDKLAGLPITATAIVDLFNYVGKCVVSGNVRRSAEIMLGDPEDEEFLDLKNPEIHAAELEDRRWASNNSIRARIGMSYAKPARRSGKNGEPGYLWMENIRGFGRMIDPQNNKDHRAKGSNPCVEQTLEDRELCCLVETFPARHANYDEYQRTLKFAYLYAKTVVLLPTHSQKTNEVMSRNRRIGTSQSGIVQNFAKIGRREHFRWCDRGYQYIQALDEMYSEWLACRRSIKTTSVKPSGTVSKLCGATSGIHYPPAQWYIQRIRFAVGSPLLDLLVEAGYPTEPCIYAPNTIVVEFPTFEKDFTKSEDEVSLWEQIGNAVQMQRWWADNQVSCTVKFDGSDPERAGLEIQAALELFEDQLKGISFLPHEHKYKQAPWEPITREEYERRSATLKPLRQLDVETNEIVEKFCDSDSCTLI